MRKLHLILTGALSLGVMVGGAVAVNASASTPQTPAWISDTGQVDLAKMPDNAQIPYQCWNGKHVTLSGKAMKQRQSTPPKPGSAEHDLAMAKTKELAQIPGAVVNDGKGGQQVVIDDSKPAVQNVMKKYEAKENPECQ